MSCKFKGCKKATTNIFVHPGSKICSVCSDHSGWHLRECEHYPPMDETDKKVIAGISAAVDALNKRKS